MTDADWFAILDTIPHGAPVPEAGRRAVLESGREIIRARLAEGFDFTRTLDIGCGIGRYLIGLMALGVPREQYTGIDCSRENIDWCRNALLPVIRPEASNPIVFPSSPADFLHDDVRNGFYNPRGTVDPEQFTPWWTRSDGLDGRCTAVLLSSVLTHCGSWRAAHVLVDAAGACCAPGGKILTTWFQSPPNVATDDCARTVFTREEIAELIDDLMGVYDCRIVHDSGGETPQWHDQRFIVLEKR